MAEKPQIQAYEKYFGRLVGCLPMNDAHFIAELYMHKLLPGEINSQLKAIALQVDKASHFLDYVIKPALVSGNTSSFNNLLSIMENCGYDHVEKLGYEIKCKIGKGNNTESGMMYYVYIY